MSLEIILWIVSFFIVWEGVYIWMIKNRKENWLGHSKDWVNHKSNSFLSTFIFFSTQFVIFMDYSAAADTVLPLHYDRLIWEVVIIIALFLFLKLNKGIYEHINRKGKKKK